MPPKVPAPVMGPDREHYVPFEVTYGKVNTTEKDCPSLEKSGIALKKKEPNFKYLSNRVVASIQCHQCSKIRCVYSMNRSFPAYLQHRLDDIIYSCGMVVNITPLNAKSGLVCASDVESAFYTTRTVDRYICLYCGAQDFDAASFRQLRKQYKTVFPICVHCRSNCKEEIKLNELKVKAQKKVPDLLQRSLSFHTPSSTQTKINSCTTLTNLLSAPQTNTSSSDTSKASNPLQRSLSFLAPSSTQKNLLSVPKASSSVSVNVSSAMSSSLQSTCPEDSTIDDPTVEFEILKGIQSSGVRKRSKRERSVSQSPKPKKKKEIECVICDDVDPPGWAASTDWIDCDECQV